MCNQVVILALVMIAFTGAHMSAQDEAIHGTDAAGVQTTLIPRKAKYFLGENILLDYTISYEGDGAIAVNEGDGLGTRSFVVTAVDQAGKNAPQSTRHFDYNGHSGGIVRRGKPFTHTIPLAFYRRLEEPGIYRIRVAHNSDVTNPESAVPGDNPASAETTIEVTMPSEVEARKVVAEICAMETDIEYYEDTGGCWGKMDNYADFAGLGYPVYLPILEHLVYRKQGETRILKGIAHNPTPEATKALIRLWNDVGMNQETRIRIMSALCDRLPEPTGVRRTDRQNPIQLQDVDPQLVKRSWRDEFARPLREIASTRLREGEPISVQCGAYILESIGAREDVPILADSLTRWIPLVDQLPPTRMFGADDCPTRKSCVDLAIALEAMTIRGIIPHCDPATPGEKIHFILSLKNKIDFRPHGWEGKCEAWIKSESTFLREFVLFNTPLPLAPQILPGFQNAIRMTIQKTLEPRSMHRAVQRAVEMEIPVDEVLSLLVDRLNAEEQVLYKHVYTCLDDLIQTGKHEHHYWACTPDRDTNQMDLFRAVWKKFLLDNGDAIRKGKHFSDDSDEYQKTMNLESYDQNP